MTESSQGPLAEASMAPGELQLDKWSAVKVGPGQWQVVAGGTLQVEMITPLSSETANIGETFEARTVQALRSGNTLLAPSGAVVKGHVIAVDRASRLIKADLPSHHWLDANGALGLHFDTIAGEHDQQITLNAEPLAASEILRYNQSADRLVVDKSGDVTVLYNGLKNGAIGAAIGGVSLAGPVGMMAAPFISGIAGAISPATAYGKPTEDVPGHRRLKGFFMGMVRGVPGGELVAQVAQHGVEAVLAPGDELTLQVKAADAAPASN